MILLAVNFHYVADRAPEEPRAIFPVSTKDLVACLEELARSFEFVTRDALLDASAGERTLPARGCLVTFDDGLRSQVELALPVLQRLGAPAIFFVPGLPLLERRVLHVHKLHQLREELSDEDFEAIVRSDLGDERLDAVSDAAATAMYRYDTSAAARVKYLLNVKLASSEREAFVDRIFHRVLGDETVAASSLYMSQDHVRELEHGYGAIGAHGYSHRALAPLSHAEVLDDLRRASAAIAGITGVVPRTISYPYGSRDTVDDGVATAAAQAGYEAGFTMERAFNRSLESPLLLARVDANDVPGGKRPLFELLDDDVVVRPGMASARSLYVQEAA